MNVNQEPVKLTKNFRRIVSTRKTHTKKKSLRLYEPPLLKNFANFFRLLLAFLLDLLFGLSFFSFSRTFLRKTFLVERSIIVFTKQINAINMAADDHVYQLHSNHLSTIQTEFQPMYERTSKIHRQFAFSFLPFDKYFVDRIFKLIFKEI